MVRRLLAAGRSNAAGTDITLQFARIERDPTSADPHGTEVAAVDHGSKSLRTDPKLPCSPRQANVVHDGPSDFDRNWRRDDGRRRCRPDAGRTSGTQKGRTGAALVQRISRIMAEILQILPVESSTFDLSSRARVARDVVGHEVAKSAAERIQLTVADLVDRLL